MLARLADGAAISRRYTFLARDMLGLLHADPALAAQYRAVRERRILFTGVAGASRTQGLILPLDDETVDDLVHALWIIAETWWPSASLTADTRMLRTELGSCGWSCGRTWGITTKASPDRLQKNCQQGHRGSEHVLAWQADVPAAVRGGSGGETRCGRCRSPTGDLALASPDFEN